VLDEIPTAAERLGAAVVIAGSFVTVSTPRRPSEQDESSGPVRETAHVTAMPGRVAARREARGEIPVSGASVRGPR